MSARYAYFYFMGTDADRVRATAPTHAAHWRELGLDDYLGGPFEDRSGGLITFRVESEAQANSAVATDPFVTTGLLETYWIKRWGPRVMMDDAAGRYQSAAMNPTSRAR